MRFDILTIFPKIFDSYFNESIIRRGREKRLVQISAWDIRKFSRDKHKKVDDKPYGGGAGMVLQAPPVVRMAAEVLRRRKGGGRKHIVLLSAKGKAFTQKLAYRWVGRFEHIILISGRYEGIDERVRKILKAEEISIGPYITTDGDVAAMVVVSALVRLIQGVIKLESLEEESHWNSLAKGEARGKMLEYPHYTRPEILEWKGRKYRVPRVLLSGDHKKIAAWRKAHQKPV